MRRVPTLKQGIYTHPRHLILPIGLLMFNLYCVDHRVFVRLFILARLLPQASEV